MHFHLKLNTLKAKLCNPYKSICKTQESFYLRRFQKYVHQIFQLG